MRNFRESHGILSDGEMLEKLAQEVRNLIEEDYEDIFDEVLNRFEKAQITDDGGSASYPQNITIYNFAPMSYLWGGGYLNHFDKGYQKYADRVVTEAEEEYGGDEGLDIALEALSQDFMDLELILDFNLDVCMITYKINKEVIESKTERLIYDRYDILDVEKSLEKIAKSLENFKDLV